MERRAGDFQNGITLVKASFITHWDEKLLFQDISKSANSYKHPVSDIWYSDIFVPSGVWAVPLSPSPAMTTPDVSGEAREEFLNIYSENILQFTVLNTEYQLIIHCYQREASQTLLQLCPSQDLLFLSLCSCPQFWKCILSFNKYLYFFPAILYDI